MTQTALEHFEDHLDYMRAEFVGLFDWKTTREKWFHGETIDPVYEGIVRDFCIFDESMQQIHRKVGSFMTGVEQLASGLQVLSEGVIAGLAHAPDKHIAAGTCKLKEATNQIARADAPHSAIAKLRRDMHFNILTPVQNHIANNRQLKMSLDVRRRRLLELQAAKKGIDDMARRNISKSDRRYMQAQSAYESAKMAFQDVDRHVFEWLYILEEYRGDILDSTLQTLKYLQYEFFASSAHAISSSLPARMEFRPMVEMTPEHLEAQVEMELQESEELPDNGVEDSIVDFSRKLIEKKTKEAPEDDAGPPIPVCALSLSCLLSQGFEEGRARRALRLHHNDTQAALDWLIDGGTEESERAKIQQQDGVRMPTTVKRVQKLKAMRRAQAEKLQKEREVEKPSPPSKSQTATEAAESSGSSQSTPPPAAKQPEDLMSMLQAEPAPPPKSSAVDLLGFGEEESPTDFSKPVDTRPLPAQFSFDASQCEKPPLPAAVAKGVAQPRDFFAGGDPFAPAAPQAQIPGMTPEMEVLAAQANVSPQQLLLAAQQLAAMNKAGAPPAAAAGTEPFVPPPRSPTDGPPSSGACCGNQRVPAPEVKQDPFDPLA
eukprot:gnl/TRDRNA2_/TRDRNA2_135766_c0_seq1.p1 gnl/TRDRNA2_/TRDRNA2_135766_c0~~gnl/TRDRNA2_/TRDRNA2_135766_c0_seq1.p1  ORF type:complete len:601 (-),score=146.72 gnl/TRDRNA2_/TRDRNA2_135766_c0_seq1:103-1905(-)